jgi:hypothetical protein
MGALSSNGAYLVLIQKGGSGGVQANAQAKLNLRVENRWINILEAIGYSGDSTGLIGEISKAFNSAALFTGNNFLPNIATTHVWRGSNGLEIQLALRFDAYDDPQKDVIDPVKELIAMFMPGRGDGSGTGNAIGNAINAAANAIPGATNAGQWFMHPPGPTPWEFLQGKAAASLFSVTLGRMMKIDNLIPTALEWEFENRFDTNGRPIAANVVVGFMNYTIPSSSDVLGYFKF